MPKGWFGPKKIGWGASPRTWQGWLATAVFVAVAAVRGRLIGPRVALHFWVAPRTVSITAVAIEIILFLLLIRATYDPEA